MCNAIIGWVRDAKGVVTRRTFKDDICNALTTFIASPFGGADGLGRTTPYILEVYYV